MTTLAAIKRSVRPGDVFDVTNHFIKREDHPAYGTTRRTVARVTSGRFYLAYPGTAKVVDVQWPKAGQVHTPDDGDTILLFGGGAGQSPADLFLTLRRVKD